MGEDTSSETDLNQPFQNNFTYVSYVMKMHKMPAF